MANGDRIVWSSTAGGEAIAGPIRVDLAADVIPDIGCAGWRGLVLLRLDYRPGELYRVQHQGCAERDLLPIEMQCCADWLARLDRRYLHAGQGV